MERATSFYTCAGKLDIEASRVSAVARVTHLADHANAGMIVTYSLSRLMDCYLCGSACGPKQVDDSHFSQTHRLGYCQYSNRC